MSEKKLTTRIQQKTDTKANWDKATNFVPLKGEYIYYSDLHKVKVGDGVTKVGSLPFLADSDTHQSIKALNTNNTSAQTVSSSEAIAGSGTINLHKVAKTGSYNDLNNKPTIPSPANNGKLTIQKNGATVATFTANQSGNATANISVPTSINGLTGGTVNGDIVLTKQLKFTDNANPLIEMSTDGKIYYFQSYLGQFSLGPSWDLATKWSSDGSVQFPGNVQVGGKLTVGSVSPTPTNPDIIMSNGSDQTKYGMTYLWHNDTRFNFPARTGSKIKTLATTDDISSEIKNCVTTYPIELVSYTSKIDFESGRVTEIYLDIEGMESHAWDRITIDPSAAVSGGNSISSMTNFYYNYMGTKTQLRLTGPNVGAINTDGYLMQFTINNADHILVRGKAIKLEDNKNTFFISQDPAKIKARLYFVDNSLIGYQLQLVGPQDLSNYVTADDVHLYEHRIQLRQLESAPQSGSVDTIGSLVLYSKYNTVINSAEKLYKILQQEITYLSGPTVVIRYTDIDNPRASAEPCTTIVHYTDSSGNGRYRFGGYNGASYSGSGGVISVYEDTVRTIR